MTASPLTHCRRRPARTTTLFNRQAVAAVATPDEESQPGGPCRATGPWSVRHRAGRALSVTALAAATVLGIQASAQAAPPDHFAFSGTDTFVDPDVCGAYGFSVNTVVQVDFSGIVKLDSNGAPYADINHVRATVTLSANGRTVTDIDHFQAIAELPDGTLREVGSVVHVMGPNGLVIRDSGQIVHNPDGTFTVKGPHPVLEGTGTFCTALMP